MPTSPLINGLSGHLQSSESWGQQLALELLREIFAQSMNSLTSAQQRDYVKLQREALAALNAVEDENARLIAQFKSDGLRQLRDKLGGLDPNAITLHTRYLEKVEPPLPWEPRSSDVKSLLTTPRHRRTLDEWKYRSHHSSLTLWEAACLNFDFGTSVRQVSGHSFVDASYLRGVEEKQLTVSQFISICRELDLGGKLQASLAKSLGPEGKLHSMIQACTRTQLRFDALEAYRNRANTGVTLTMYESILDTIEGRPGALSIDTLSMDLDKTLIPIVAFVPIAGNRIPVPLLLIHTASLGVVSYFPFRPSGAMRFHLDTKAASAHFHAELKSGHRDGDLGWFSRQLPVTEVNLFKELLTTEPRPEGLSLVAGFLYDSFHTLFPERTLDDIRFVADPKHGRAQGLVQALSLRHVHHYQTNLGLLASQRSERDLQGVIDGTAALARELMNLLMTPVPGGVTGLNRVMQLVVFGNLGYSLIIGIDQAAKGEASDFAAALADVADLAVNGLLISTAGRVHRQRIEGLLSRMGNPRKITHSDGTHALWKPDISPYAVSNQRVLRGQIPNAQGLYLLNGKHYVQVQQGDQRLVAEVTADPKTMGFVLKRPNGNGYAAPIVFEPKLQAWVLDLHGVSQLSDSQLIEQMLPNGAATIAPAQVRNLLRSTAVPRATLDKIWAGEPSPVNLIEAIRRVQIDRVIDQLTGGFHRHGDMPAHAGSAILSLLTQLPTWPSEAVIHVHDQQKNRIESYAAQENATLAINLKRKDDGTYIALDAADTTVASQESLFELIIAQQPHTSTLGKEGSKHLTERQRIARLRLQISALAGTHRIALFSAMTRYAGQARHQVPAGDAARRFVPIMAAGTGVDLTPLLTKLHERFAPLSPANLQQLLEHTPLDSAQKNTFLKDGTLPDRVREHLELHRTALRIDAVIDGLYHPRAFNADTDLWAREFAASVLLERCKRQLVVTEMASGTAQDRYQNTGPDDTTVELIHYGDGRYEAYDMRNAGTIPVSPVIDSFYLAIGSVLQPHERTLLGMKSASDAQGLRENLGDLMSERRSPDGLVSLFGDSLVQYQKHVVLPTDVQPNPEGLYDWNGDQLVALGSAYYPVTFDKQRLKWRLKHPGKIGVDSPHLEHNRQGAWRLESESPLSWDDHLLFSRLGVKHFNVDQATATRILQLTDTPARALREVHCAGLPPPPLLQDSSKRFGIEKHILHFINAMTTYSAKHTARPSLQLLLVTGLPKWPPSHVLQVLDDDGQVLAHYPAANAGAAEKIRLTQAQSRSAEPLIELVRNDALTRALLDELPDTLEERLFKLAKSIAEHAYRERTQLFDTLYAQSERSSNGLHTRLRTHYPQLPASVIDALLHHATPNELKQLRDHNQVPLRLSEQARLTADDVRLNRAYEGLYLTTLANPDSEKIVLHVLRSVPGWPADVRLDIHQGSASGPLLESAGHLSGKTRKILARVDERYQAYDAEGEPIGAVSDLLTAIYNVLSDSQRTALGLDDSGDLGALRQTIAELALNQRIAIKDLLGLPHIPYWLQPPTRVNSSFAAYPFSLRNLWPASNTQPVDLVSKVQALYPRMSRADANDLLASLNMNDPAALLELERRKAEYQTLEYGLEHWATTEQPHDADDPTGLNLACRRFAVQQILQAWRRETQQNIAGGLFHPHALVLQLDANSLPDVDFMLGTQGFAHIEYLKISGNAFPATGNAFLGKFIGVKSLRLDCMLTHLPISVTDMAHLEFLDLSDNDIVLTPDARQRLAGLHHLEMLNLDGNPLSLTPDVTGMNYLRNLNLQQTGISQWPIGAEQLTRLHSLLLQENQITSVPETLFTNAAMRSANRGTILHDNPLDAETLQRLTEYHRRTGTLLGGAMPGALHVLRLPDDLISWLEGVPKHEHAQRKVVWEQLQKHEGASPDDVFRVLRDLTQAYDYITPLRRPPLIARVWRILHAMAGSHQLRESIYLNTYQSGTCGDGAILVLSNMEILHKQHQAMARPNSNQANRDLLELAEGLFYLRSLDQLADDHLLALRIERGPGGPVPDDVEVKLYLRLHFRVDYKLPLQHEERLYAPGDDLTREALTQITQKMAALKTTSAAENSLLMEDFWIKYLARCLPEPFATIEDVTRYKLDVLKQEVPDTHSMDYQERRQSINEEKEAELNRLVDQLTRAARSGAQRVS
ncbi:NEL-type E3 ubiquitin ligase domain-containing protein [Pseudomonas sp. Marseille-Q1929]|uniref:NEL-type E3 ubiquitin ligase domain-containing protein n=1 Tax=Pseudomonas sp. Marseille-Q1929 TaxID=2730402 RepID=UPI001A8FB9B4|nr:NEL-type E3 ubiquitin ligase domain-containing protein [Pseudomonas sp. Marseille-Q1929]MBO0491728.1 hypothetical protein [Pseudomonas sp. Marseille-Q1929]